MVWWQAVILGVIQGLTEFLPISSSGHLLMAEQALQVDQQLAFPFLVYLHFGTLLAILVYFWAEIKALRWLDYIKLAVAVVPIGVLGLLLHSSIENMSGTNFLILTYLITAVLLLFAEALLRWHQRNGFAVFDRFLNKLHAWITGKSSPSFAQAVIIGLMQAIALLPGVSRSGSALTGSLVAGLSPQKAFSFTFLLGVPTILAAVGYDFATMILDGTWVDLNWPLVALGILTSTLVGLLALLILKWFWQQRRLWPFAFYCLFVSVLLVFLA